MSLIAARNTRGLGIIAYQFSRLGLFAATVVCVCLLGLRQPAANAAQRGSVGPGLVQEFPATLVEVKQALDELLEDDTIHGTYIYEKERTLTGAKAVPSTPLFEQWKGCLLYTSHASKDGCCTSRE